MYRGKQTSFSPPLCLPLAIPLVSFNSYDAHMSVSSVLKEVMQHFHKQPKEKP